MHNHYLINELKQIYQSSQLIPFLGAGLSQPFNIPNWSSLIKDCAIHMGIENVEEIDLLPLINLDLEKQNYWKAVKNIKDYLNCDDRDIQTYVVDRIKKDVNKNINNDVHNYYDLAKCNFNLYLTTNYDHLLYKYIDSDVIPMSLHTMDENMQRALNDNSTKRVVHLHGHISDTTSIVLSEEKYRELYNDNKYNKLFSLLTGTKTFLFIGFSYDDIFIQRIIAENNKYFNSKHYILLANPTEKQIKFLKDKHKIETLSYNPLLSSHSEEIRKILRLIHSKNDISIKKNQNRILEKTKKKCINIVEEQIRIYAGKKFIPGLYVERNLEGIINLFHSSEQSLATYLTENITKQVKDFREICISLIESYNELEPNIMSFKDNEIALTLFQEYFLNSLDTIGRNTNDYEIFIKDNKNITSFYKDSLKLIEDLKLINKIANELFEHVITIKNNKNLIQIEMYYDITKILSKLNEETKKINSTLTKNNDTNYFHMFNDYLKIIESGKELRDSRNIVIDNETKKAKNFINNVERMFTSTISLLDKNINNTLNLIKYNTFLIIDRAGGGKTNLLCKLAKDNSFVAPTILLFGKENFNGEFGLIERIKDILKSTIEIQELDDVLANSGQFLHIYIDGINECGNVSIYKAQILKFLNWSKNHRIRITITCRDIYWDFFKSDDWNKYVYKKEMNKLYEFTNKEYSKAILLYLRHYKIDCVLKEHAQNACYHPLFLKFFCEAYSSNSGETVQLGKIYDIRLKEVFDIYYRKKIQNIQNALGHSNPNTIYNVLLLLTEQLYKQQQTYVYDHQLMEITKLNDISTCNSIYIRLLDEDIIIEEKPYSNIMGIDIRKVQFVYEEFMEYILAMSFIFKYLDKKTEEFMEFMNELLETQKDWVNARGVVEYIILILLSSEVKKDISIGMTLLEELINRGNIWINAFWSIVSKVPTDILNSKLFDMFYDALYKGIQNEEIPKIYKKELTDNKIRIISETIDRLSRYSKNDSYKITTTLFGIGLFPNIFKWSDIQRLEDFDKNDLDRLCLEIEQKVNCYKGKEIFYDSNDNYKKFIRSFLPSFSEEARKDILKLIRIKSGSKRIDSLKNLSKNFFNENREYMLNGIFSSYYDISEYCAINIRFIKKNKKQIAYICDEISKFHKDERIKQLLEKSVDWLTNYLY